MLLTKIGIKNFKSFGNNYQSIEFDPEVGELILLTGINGAGKSSFKEAIEFALFSKVKKKSGEGVIAKEKLANRFNKCLHTSVEFLGSDSKRTHIRVEREVKPDRLVMWEDHNDQQYDRIGKGNIDKKIEEYVGLDYRSYLSFISMSINDFKNFMSLTSDDKKLLLDRLFNLSIVNELKKVITTLSSQNQLEIENYEKDIDSYSREIESLQESIENIKENAKTNLKEEIKQVRQLMLDQKERFIKLETKIQKLEEKKQAFDEMYQTETEQLNNTVFELRTVETQIKVYSSGKCTKCHTDLTTETNLLYKKELEEKRDTLLELKEVIEQNIIQYDSIAEEFERRNQKTNESYNEIRFYLSDLKKKLTKLKSENESGDADKEVVGVKEFNKLINKVTKKKEAVEEKSVELEKKKNVYKQLEKIFGDNGIKKVIIGNLVKVINTYVKENLDLIKFPYTVTLDDKFDANITYMNMEVDPELLSNGEARKVNLSIMLAYLKVIRSKRRINILFLDEVFASIDVEAIEDILKLFKNFALEYKTLVFLVHHAQIGEPWFDRIIKFEKNVTTTMTETRKNSVVVENQSAMVNED